MKRLFTFIALTLAIALSCSVSAQSSKLIGEWNSSTGSQKALLESIGGTIEKAKNTMTFNNDGTYATYSYVVASADLSGIKMRMLLELTENGTWKYSDERVYMTSTNFDVIQIEISFDDPSMNAMSEEVIKVVIDAFKQGVGVELPLDVEFISDNEVHLSFDSEYITFEYILVR